MIGLRNAVLVNIVMLPKTVSMLHVENETVNVNTNHLNGEAKWTR